MDWTIAGHQHLLVVSLAVGRRAVPIYGRAYDAAVLKERMQHDALAVIRRAVTWKLRKVGRRRVRVTADRGFADVPLFDLLAQLSVAFVIRVKKSTKVWGDGTWRRLPTLRFPGNTRRRALERLRYYAQRSPPLWVTMSRTRKRHEIGGIWYLIANRPYPAPKARAEYVRRPGCAFPFPR